MWRKWIKIVSILLLIDVISIGVVLRSVDNIKTEALREEKERMDENLTLIESKMELEINKMLADITNKSNMSDLIDLLSISKENMLNGSGDRVNSLKNKYNAMLTEIADDMDYLFNLSILNKDGLVYSSVHPEMVGIDESGRYYYKEIADQNKELALNSLYLSHQEPLITVVSTPLLRDTVGLGVVVAMVDDLFYKDIIKDVGVSRAKYLLVNGKDKIMYSNHHEKIGKYYKKSPDKLIYEKEISDKNWRFIAEEKKDSVMAVTKEPIKSLYELLVVIITGSILVAGISFYRLRKTVQ